MALSLEHRRVGDVYVVTCTGRLVEGAESLALQHLLDGLLPFTHFFILDVGAVDFVDSSGLGLLVRYAARLRHMQGKLTLCGASSKTMTLLNVTRLADVFDIHESEAGAIGAAHRTSAWAADPAHRAPEVLCVTGSVDVQAYIRELLAHAGYRVLTAGNLPDALVLLRARRPQLLVVAEALRHAPRTLTAQKFNQLADGLPIVELPADFSHRDAAGAGAALVDQVRAISPLA